MGRAPLPALAVAQQLLLVALVVMAHRTLVVMLLGSWLQALLPSLERHLLYEVMEQYPHLASTDYCLDSGCVLLTLQCMDIIQPWCDSQSLHMNDHL